MAQSTGLQGFWTLLSCVLIPEPPQLVTLGLSLSLSLNPRSQETGSHDHRTGYKLAQHHML